MRRSSQRRHTPRVGAATIKQVAAEAGVSTATVSRVLSNWDGVGGAARDRVLRAVRTLDYRPNRFAQGLRRAGLRRVIGVIIPDLQNPFLTGVVHGIEAVLYNAGYTLVLGHSDGVAKREQTHLAVMRAEGVSGMILIPANEADSSYAFLESWQIPLVAVDRMPVGLQIDLVNTNNREGVREAVGHLIAHNHKEIAYISGPAGLSVAQERLRGYKDALEAANLTARESLIVHSDFRQEGGHQAMNRLLAMHQPPSAVIVANNLMTLGALEAIHEQGVRAPEDIAIVGFDDMPWAASLHPPLTAVAQPVEELGQTAAQLLLERLKDPERLVRQVVLPARLMIRASCGCAPELKGEATPSLESNHLKEELAAPNPIVVGSFKPSPGKNLNDG